jgi:hypothetical protein
MLFVVCMLPLLIVLGLHASAVGNANQRRDPVGVFWLSYEDAHGKEGILARF